MPKLSVEQRVQLLHDVFNNFGISVAPNSELALAIQTEFGRGKRSKLNELLPRLQQDTDAAHLASCIGAHICKNFVDQPEWYSMGIELQERIPALLRIVDIRQDLQQRIALLSAIVDHFHTKIAAHANTDGSTTAATLLRALEATRANLAAYVHSAAIGHVVHNLGIALNTAELTKFGTILHTVMPTLLSLHDLNATIEQKSQYVARSLAVLGEQLHNLHLQTASKIVHNGFLVYKVLTTEQHDVPTYEAILQELDVSCGDSTIQQLTHKAHELGLSDQELQQVLYHMTNVEQLPVATACLLTNTRNHQRYAAACSLVARIAQDLNFLPLQKTAVAGLCLVSLKQAWLEMQQNNFHAVNFSEACGSIVSNVGIITNNSNLQKFGAAINAGVKTYNAVAATTGNMTIAIPLALCTALGKILLHKKSRQQMTKPTAENQLQKILLDFVKVQTELRQQFVSLQKTIIHQHYELLSMLDSSMQVLQQFIANSHDKVLYALENIQDKMLDYKVMISQEFAELHMQGLYQPLQTLEFLYAYDNANLAQINMCRQKLLVWIMCESKQPKINGAQLFSVEWTNSQKSKQIISLLSNNTDYLSLLVALNKYSNDLYNLALDEDLPHIPAWIKAVEKYLCVMQNFDELNLLADEHTLLNDMLLMANKIYQSVNELCNNTTVLKCIYVDLQAQLASAKQYCMRLLELLPKNILAPISAQQSDARLDCPQNTIATLHNVQLEKFNQFCVDVRTYAEQYLLPAIPSEFLLLCKYQQAKIHYKFAVDAQYNQFHEVIMNNGNFMLPDESRDVLFRIELYFTLPNQNEHLLALCWLSYDLQTTANRFTQYYQKKHARLSHPNYAWVSMDGTAVCVERHPITTTIKPVNFAAVTTVYNTWFSQAVPINRPEIFARLSQKPHFYAAYKPLFVANRCYHLQLDTIASLQPSVVQALHDYIWQQRSNLASTLRADQFLQELLLDVHAKILLFRAYHALHQTQTDINADVRGGLAQLITNLQTPAQLQIDLAAELQAVFNPLLPDPSLFSEQTSRLPEVIHSIMQRLDLLLVILNSNNSCTGVLRNGFLLS